VVVVAHSTSIGTPQTVEAVVVAVSEILLLVLELRVRVRLAVLVLALLVVQVVVVRQPLAQLLPTPMAAMAVLVNRQASRVLL
jgi:hypothetical protein